MSVNAELLNFMYSIFCVSSLPLFYLACTKHDSVERCVDGCTSQQNYKLKFHIN